ncbi:DUF1697 domain-containing protein [Kitasatospora sp. NPDC085879]|uniref:DUF1697 domain-containing protein n=1 Tax=Kitasatospora sp. NPDC085879 TaxID=3154769 RepID=UPI003412088C
MTQTYIAFLRAINVGGRTVTMQRLRELFGELGLAGVRTYIQSGNVFFETDEADRAALTARIEEQLEQALGYPVPTVLCTLGELEEVVAADPFAGIEVTPELRLCVLFLSEPLPAELTPPVSSPKGDWELVGALPKAAFVVLHLRGGRMGGNPATLFGKAFAGTATSRFFHTTVKILAAAKK